MSLFEQMVAKWGSKCPDYEPTCCLCRAWFIFEGTGIIPNEEQVVRNIQQNSGCDFFHSPILKEMRECGHGYCGQTS